MAGARARTAARKGNDKAGQGRAGLGRDKNKTRTREEQGKVGVRRAKERQSNGKAE